MAHPIRPESYISMDNFYTSTVYSKGAEIVGIYKTLLGTAATPPYNHTTYNIHTHTPLHPEDKLPMPTPGVEGFKRGLKLYFDRFDGKAVTCDDFRDAMAGNTTHPSIHPLSIQDFSPPPSDRTTKNYYWWCWVFIIV